MSELPNGVSEIIEYLAHWARGYNNHLKWNEVAQFKADLMNTTARWRVIDPNDFHSACLEAGMRPEDADTLTDLLRKRKQNRRLVPQKSYRDFSFQQPVTVFPERKPVVSSPIW